MHSVVTKTKRYLPELASRARKRKRERERERERQREEEEAEEEIKGEGDRPRQKETQLGSARVCHAFSDAIYSSLITHLYV